MTASLVSTAQSPSSNTPRTVTTAAAINAGDVLVAIDIGTYTTTAEHGTALSGLGTTWTRVAAARTLVSEVWVGTAPSPVASGQVLTQTATTLAAGAGRRLFLYTLRGITNTTVVNAVENTTGGTVTSSGNSADDGQFVLAFGYSDTSPDSLKSLSPGSGWSGISNVAIFSTTRWAGFATRIPTSLDSHSATASRPSGATAVTVVTMGDSSATPLTSTFVGWGNPIF